MIKGRGTDQEIAGRFQRQTVSPVDDGWPDTPHEESSAPETRCTEENARSIITRNQSPDVPFEQSINPYRGCEHGCIYCFARPSHAYVDLSPGIDFETRLTVKTNAPALLRKALAGRSYRCSPIVLGTNTDPYQPIERQYRVTRELLGILDECRHPVSIITKGSGILRDLDLLTSLARDNLVSVMVSLTSMDAGLKRSLEPRAASPQRRLHVMRTLAENGVPVGALIAPVIPALTDHELEDLLHASADAGCDQAGYVLLRLPWEVRPLFQDWLEAHYPDRAARVMNRLRQTRGGRDNDPGFGSRMRGTGPWADLLGQRFHAATRRYGLDCRRDTTLATHLFRAPDDTNGQLSLNLG